MKTIIKCIIYLLIIIPFGVNAAACTSVIDFKSGRTLYKENDSTEFLIASTTKIMTALATLNNIDINKKVTVSSEVLDAYGSAIYIKPGEKILIKDLLYGLMLRSGNDAALVLAKNVGGSTLGFVKIMNETAKAIGMKNTKFYNPHGLDEETQNISTCHDLTLLLREAMKNKEFRKITKTKEYKLKTNFNTYTWHNKNKLLTIYKNANGGKIGYTKRAGHTFVSSAKMDDRQIIIATIKDDDMFNNHKNLYENLFKQYRNYNLIDKHNLKIKYDKNYKVYTNSSFSALLKKEELKNIEREIILYKKENKNFSELLIGKIRIKLDGKILTEKNIYAKKLSKGEKSFKYQILNKLKNLIK